MNPARGGGVLLHLSSLPGPDGIGDLGETARTWIRWARSGGLSLWQFLPTGPVGPKWSPYQSPSTFAGNPLFISLDRLVDTGWLPPEARGHAVVDPARVDYPAVARFKTEALDEACRRWQAGGRTGREAFEAWSGENRWWLDDYSLYAAIKESQGGLAWTRWDLGLARREKTALADARRRLRDRIEAIRLTQYWFHQQWQALRSEANGSGLRLVGDLPIYVAFDSADVWSRPDLFQLDADGNPRVVAGVPPDYFSATGQLWSNPIYRWDRHRQEGFAWWVQRLRHLAARVDVIRLDHFRGLEAYWEVPAGEATAVNGRWVEGPGGALLEALRDGLGDLPLIAEDLGMITEAVVHLRQAFDLPGMHVLQFDLEAGDQGPLLGGGYPERGVVYTGTHDNDTSRGWYDAADESTRDFVRRHLASDGSDIPWRMIEAVWGSPAGWTVAPLQDFLGLGSEARMNVPGRTDGNWSWRIPEGALTAELAGRILDLNRRHGRA